MKRQNAEKTRITYRTNRDSPATPEYMRGNTCLNKIPTGKDQGSFNKKEKGYDQGLIFIDRSYTSSLHAGLIPVSGSTYARYPIKQGSSGSVPETPTPVGITDVIVSASPGAITKTDNNKNTRRF